MCIPHKGTRRDWPAGEFMTLEQKQESGGQEGGLVGLWWPRKSSQQPPGPGAGREGTNHHVVGSLTGQYIHNEGLVGVTPPPPA